MFTIMKLKKIKMRIQSIISNDMMGIILTFGSGSAKSQISIICRNIDDAIKAIKTGKDQSGNPITKSQIGLGLHNLVKASKGNSNWITMMKLSLNEMQLSELISCLEKLDSISKTLE